MTITDLLKDRLVKNREMTTITLRIPGDVVELAKTIADADVIDQAATEAAIHKFKAMGETEWQSATAVPCERLPRVSFNEALVGVD